jgi:hypothetical protein
MTRFLLLSDSSGFVDVERPLWWEDGNDVYNCCWPSVAQSFSGSRSAGPTAQFYCLSFKTLPNGWPGYIPRHGVPFSSPLTTHRAPVSKSKSLYDWRFADIHFVFGSSPLRHTTTDAFFQLNPCGNSPYVTSSLTRRWVCLLWICVAFRQVYVSHL